MSNWMETIRKDNSPILEKLDSKMRKKVKKTLQASQPTEFFGQDFTRLGELLETMKSIGVEKKENKKLEAAHRKLDLENKKLAGDQGLLKKALA